MRRNIAVVLFFFCFSLAPSKSFAHGLASYKRAPSNVLHLWQVPLSYIYAHKLLLTLGLTAYYTILDANKQSADFREWKIDGTTISNIVWRSILYGAINCYEGNIRKRSASEAQEWLAEQNYRIGLVKTSASMITYNTRYNETVIQRQAEFNETIHPYAGEYSSYLSLGALFLTNVGWFFVVPMLWSPQVSTLFIKHTSDPASLAVSFYAWTGISVLGLAAYSVVDLVQQHLLVSVKHTIAGLLPAPGDLRFFRFPDCTSCYFFSNLFGKTAQEHAWKDNVKEDL